MTLFDYSRDWEIFCTDTSALIYGWREAYPPDVFASVWDGIGQLASNGILIAPEEVLLELERREDELYQWARSHRSMFAQPDIVVQQEVKKIVNRWPTFIPEISPDGAWADPYVIALATVRRAVVVTAEKPVGANARRPKIPNVCYALNIPCTDLLGLLRSQGWNF